MDSKVKKEGFQTKEDVVAARIKKEIDDIKKDAKKFTGVLHAFKYRPHEGFADFCIVTLQLKNGVVESVTEVSDPYAAIECRIKMEIKQAYHIEKMRLEYPAGFQHV